MNIQIQDLDPAAIVMPFVPLTLHVQPFETLDVTYAFPASYHAGEISIGECQSIDHAIFMANGCRAYDGAGYVYAIARPKGGVKERVQRSPWGRPPQPSEAIEQRETAAQAVNV